MKKPYTARVLIITALAATILLLAGGRLGNNLAGRYSRKQEANTVGAKNVSQPVEISITHWSAAYREAIEQAIEEYAQKDKDNIRIKIVKIPRDRYNETVNMLMTSGQGPDILGLDEVMQAAYVLRNWAANLTKYVDEDFFEKFPQWAIEFSKDPIYSGRFYTIPCSIITFRLIYNKEMFKKAGLDPEKPPETLDDLRLYANRITHSNGLERKYGFALPAGEEWIAFIHSMEMPNTISGIYYYDFEKNEYDLTVYESWFKEILAMKEEGSLFPGETSLKYDTARAQFAQGNIGMMYACSWDPSVFAHTFSVNFEWGVAMPPLLDRTSKGKHLVCIGPGTCYIVNPNTKNMEEAVKVWKYLYSEEYLGALYKSGVELPILKGMIGNTFFKPFGIYNFDMFIPGQGDSDYLIVPRKDKAWENRSALYLDIISGEHNGKKININEIRDILTEGNIALNGF